VGLKYQPFSSYINYSDFGWLSFYEYFLSISKILKNYKDSLEFIISCIDSGIFMSVQLEGFCIVSKFPNFISRDSEDRLNNINTSAISFADGYEQFYVSGRFLEKELFNKILEKKYTFQDFTKEQNEEVKSASLSLMQQKFGDEYLFRFLSEFLKEIDTYIDKKDKKYLKGTTEGMNIGVYTLFKGEVNNETIAYCRCYCPSTDRMFFLGVDPGNINAKYAIASLYTVPKKLKPYIKDIRRQGEKFSTTFSSEGITLLHENKLTKEDLEDLIPISGAEYFKTLTYEY